MFCTSFFQVFPIFKKVIDKIIDKMSTNTPLCVAYKLSRFGVLDDLRTRKMDPDKLAHNYVRLYLHASVSVYTCMQVYPERHLKMG